MWWRERREKMRLAAQFGALLAMAGLLAGCFQPLYGRNPAVADESVHDKLGEVLVAPIPSRQGTAQARMAVAMHNALQYDLNGGAGAVSPTHRLEVVVTPTDITVTIDPVTGRPTEEIGGLNATYRLVEIATGKIVVTDSTFAHVGYDIPGTGEQRFSKQRSQLDAQGRAVHVAADAIRNRLASYFVAGT